MREDFDLIERYPHRVLVGLSLTGTPEKQQLTEILEPHASPIEARMAAMVEARARGLRTYAMLCPLLPGVADSPEQVDRLVRFATECGAEEFFAEPVNARGPGLRHCQEALEVWGHDAEAEAIKAIRNRKGWSAYVVALLRNVQNSVRRHSDIRKLRFLLYPGRLLPQDVKKIRNDDAGVIWLGKQSPAEATRRQTA